MTITLDPVLGVADAIRQICAPPPPPSRQWRTPGDLAIALDPRTVQTPALDVIDEALVDVGEGRINRLMISLPPQEGKALALDTPIATPTGWTTMGAIQVGDKVFDRQGEPCTVTWISPTWRGRPCYDVRTGDGEHIVADAAHEWVARLDRRSPEHIYETTTLARPRAKNAQITGPADLNLPDAALPLPPYVLGAWLGDGTSRAATITFADEEIAERIRDEGVPCRKSGYRYAWSLAPDDAGSRVGKARQDYASPVRRALISLGVWGNKHIPAAYLRGSAKQRLALLQGLIDTDGYVSPRGQVEFTSTNERLARDVQHLVFTLGAKATMARGRATVHGRDCGPKWRVKFYLADAAHLPRKAGRCKDSSVARIRYVWAEPTESVPVRCIEVDSPDHTYLAGRSLLPTHNSVRISRRFPEWLLTRNKDLRLAIVSYAHGVARRHGRSIRDDITTHPGTLDLAVSASSSAAHEWEIAGHEGGVYCVGIRGSLTSRPVDGLIIDDPYKDGEQADSEAWKETVREFWTEVAIPRLGPGSFVVIVQTRWRHDDLSGWLKDEDHRNRWRVINIPAQADHDPAKGEADPLGRQPGEYLRSARGRSVEEWETKKLEVGSRAWQALFQGRPSPPTGDIFNKTWWKEYHQPRWIVRDDGSYWVIGADEVVQSWDMAFKDLDSSDYVVGQVWARYGLQAYLIDEVHERMSFVETRKAVRRLAVKWPQATLKLVEDKANGTAVINSLNATVSGLVPVEPTESKLARARAIAPFAEAGQIFLPAPEIAPWIGAWIEEHAAFPRGSHDDRVDAMTQAINRILLAPILDGSLVVGAGDLDDDLDDDDNEISPW